MASIKLKFRTSSVQEKEGRLYYQVIHNRVVRQIHTAYRIYSSEWDADHSCIILSNSTTSKRNDYLYSLKETLETTKYMFFIFKHNGKDYIFKGIKLWNMPEEILEKNVKEVWIRTKHAVQTGNIVKEVLPNKRLTNFPGMSDDEVCHVRPHARDVNDTYELPIPDSLTGLTDYTKHCFWINNKYLETIIKE